MRGYSITWHLRGWVKLILMLKVFSWEKACEPDEQDNSYLLLCGRFSCGFKSLFGSQLETLLLLTVRRFDWSDGFWLCNALSLAAFGRCLCRIWFFLKEVLSGLSFSLVQYSDGWLLFVFIPEDLDDPLRVRERGELWSMRHVSSDKTCCQSLIYVSFSTVEVCAVTRSLWGRQRERDQETEINSA